VREKSLVVIGLFDSFKIVGTNTDRQYTTLPHQTLPTIRFINIDDGKITKHPTSMFQELYLCERSKAAYASNFPKWTRTPATFFFLVLLVWLVPASPHSD
jgi:hypothetical protein